MNLRLRDTLTRSVVPIEPLDAGRVRMYSCGPTVYRFAHVGNLRTFLLPDLIRRTLLYHGIDVLHVQNITDVGHLRADAAGREVDPMLVAAGLEGRPSREIAHAYEAAFHGDEALVNILPAHGYPRATEHIDDMVALAERLVALGHAYVSPIGNVYYDVSTYAAYGALSGNTLDALDAGQRSEVEPDKDDPADFALWKAADASRDLRWPSPWGEGFPGWHLECSAMALRHLGPTFDIHTGGEDNVFPHHEDEIAQSAPIVGGPPARVWVHGAHLLMRGRKMSKSAGNFQRITELGEDGLDPLAFRYLCLTARYARKLNLSERSIAAAASGLASLRADVAALGPAPAEGPWAPPAALRAGASPDRPEGLAEGLTGHGAPTAARLSDRAGAPSAPLSAAGRALHDRFVGALEDDLDMPVALRIARQALKARLPADERRWLILDMDFVLGLDLDRSVPALGSPAPRDAADLPAGAAELLAARATARAERDFVAADRLRDQLRALGVDPIDRADGTSDWRPVSEGQEAARSARVR
ncbi:MAG TPA: cysteine--tRNA ligase [Candidatus Dormibacteraeota bacterium]|nr:cysteine--tRNA ligase [Candidatus Dormibacteraeota bacterium]